LETIAADHAVWRVGAGQPFETSPSGTFTLRHSF
jgi:hypothetical protein